MKSVLYLTYVKRIALLVLVFSTSLLMTHNMLPHSHDWGNEKYVAVYSKTPPKASFLDCFKIALQLDLGVEHLDHYNGLDDDVDFKCIFDSQVPNEALIPEKRLLSKYETPAYTFLGTFWPGVICLDAHPFRGPPFLG